jgi:nucleotide-binding universal stress UspA family protein
MLERILVPLDGSPEAEAILPRIKALLGRRKSSATLLHARSPVGLAYAGVDYTAAAKDDQARMEAYLKGFIAKHAGDGPALHGRVVEGFPPEAILQVAKDERASLIAMTTHGRSGVPRWVLGSVAEKVLRGAEVPVLLLKFSAFGQPIREREIRRILFPVDGSSLAQEAVKPLVELARPFGAEVTAVHVEAPPELTGGFGTPPTGPPPATAESLAPVAALLEAAGVRVKTSMLKGDPASVILNVAGSGGVDLVVMTSHGRSGVSRMAFGSVTEKVLRGLGVPLLVVRSKGAAAGIAAA